MAKVGLLGVVAVFLALILKKEKNEYAVLIVLAAGLLIFSYGVVRLVGIIDFIRRLTDHLPIKKEYVNGLFKMLGITYMGELAANICRDSGYGSVAAQIELFMRLSIVALSLPGLSYLMDVVEELL